MFDLFTEEIEVLIKSGISNLYWYREDLKKAWLRSGVSQKTCNLIYSRKNQNGKKLSKRELMDNLYVELRDSEYNRRLEISRNFVRILVEHKNFVPQNEKHRIEIAERSALKLKEIIRQQEEKEKNKKRTREKAKKAKKNNYECEILDLKEEFYDMYKMESHKRGYKLEKFFTKLMTISGIHVQEPFKIIGEQIDGAIKYDGNYYLIELKWIEKKIDQKNIASLYMKVEGKFNARGIFIAMNGYSPEVLQSLPKGKELKVILLDGMHITNVICGMYTFQQLLEHSISQASLRGELYSSHDIK